MEELYLVVKRDKFLKGHGYCTLKGYRFNWTSDKEEARKMSFDIAHNLSILCGGVVENLI
jgi:hypothetical protein